MDDFNCNSEDERQLFLLKNKEAFRNTFFEYEFDGIVYKLPKLLHDRYIFSAKIGSGSFGTVYDVYDTDEKRFLVAKLLVVRRSNFITTIIG
jgi:hypothetical protein